MFRHKLIFCLLLKDCICEERQENFQNPENAVNSISISANNPINHTASPHYAAINFQVRSEKAGSVILQPSSSACEYSAVKFSKCSEVDPPLIRQNENEKKISSVRNMFVVKLFKISKESCDYFYVSGFKPSYLDESLTFFVTVFVCSEVFDFDRLSTSSHQQ